MTALKAGGKTLGDRKAKFLSDYKPADFSVETVSFDFSLFEQYAVVTARAVYRKVNRRVRNLRLDGEALTLLSLSIDGELYDNYEVLEDALIVRQVPNHFILSTQVLIYPDKNTLLEGLYRSAGIFCTQCEAEGFRRITYFLDRPDVMTEYTVRIEADQSKYPVLLSNGNLIEQGELAGGRHFVKWHDPFAKPAYLFALVAGDLEVIEKTTTTSAGREILLQVYTEKAFIHQADYALGALERAMHWDEKTFNLAYDLDRYMIVAIGDFNMGAMENKGLNIFNAKYVLATPQTATDKDFIHIENIIGHEYFHNWSGNRVTCRDWFQLSLKEGLTVFRDALFSADMTTKGVKRLEEVRTVREHQFVEDQGPMSHPVRPDSYIEINNFYTLTIYEKGAEIIRMMYNLLGEKAFKKGLTLYFERFDGQAVTVEDFVQAMSEASGVDLMGQFFRWYTQSGTPKVTVETTYDEATRVFKMSLSQDNSPTAGQPEKHNLMIPVAYRLYSQTGESMSSENVAVLTEAKKILEFGSVKSPPVVSLLRNFSAPVLIDYNQSDQELHTLVRHDDDLFVRFDALQTLLKRLVSARLADEVTEPKIERMIQSFMHLLADEKTPVAEKAELLTLPNLPVFFEVMSPVEVDSLNVAVSEIKQAIVRGIQGSLRTCLAKPVEFAAIDLSFAAMAERSLRNVCLDLLSWLNDEQTMEMALAQFEKADNMTNQLAALAVLNKVEGETRDKALSTFYQRFKADPQVMDKWLAIQAVADFGDACERIKVLSEHPAFSMTTPNKVRALFTTFSMHNLPQFHHVSGRGYALLASVVSQLDQLNPSLAARVVTPLTQWQRFDKKRGLLMKEKLQVLLEKQPVSKDLYEVINKSLAD